MKVQPLVWHPFRENPLDWLDSPDLFTKDGRPVQITQQGMNFVIYIDGVEVSRSDSNSATCAVLDGAGVGIDTKE